MIPVPLNDRTNKVLLTIVAVAMLNFVAFAIGTFVLHGDAVNARTMCPPGDYIAEKGGCRHVSHAAYVYSTVHSYSVMISGPFVLISLLIVQYRRAAAAADGPHRR